VTITRVGARPLAIWLLPLSLGCGEPAAQGGHVEIGVTIAAADHCPSITSAVAAPIRTSVGGAVDVRATATDPDPGEILSYAWAEAADFASPDASATVYHCPRSGPQTLIVTVTDNHQPTPCAATAALAVTCE
jgi:hypothetical protein